MEGRKEGRERGRKGEKRGEKRGWERRGEERREERHCGGLWKGSLCLSRHFCPHFGVDACVH